MPPFPSFITGITGAIISWDHELDELLNPHLTEIRSRGKAIASLELARRIEASEPRAWVTFIPLLPEEGKSLALACSPTLILSPVGFMSWNTTRYSSTRLRGRSWASANGERSRWRAKISYPFSISCISLCTCQKCGVSMIGVPGCWASSPSSGCLIASVVFS